MTRMLGRFVRLAPFVPAALLVLSGCVSLTPYSELVAGLPADGFVQVGGQRVWVEDRGAGPVVVMLHGFGASSFSWRAVDSALADRFRVLSVDLSGFGYTERPRGKEPYTRDGQGQLVLGVLDVLGIERAHLVGHSYGGAIAMALAARQPERFDSLVLVDAAGPEYPQQRRNWVAGIRPLTSVWVRTVALRRGRTVRGLRDSVVDDALVTPALVDEYWRRLKIEGAARAFWGLTAPVDPPDPEVDLRGIVLPTLVVWGCEDALISVDAGRFNAALIPDSAFVTLPDVGHLPMEERPEELVKRMRSFLLAHS